MGYDHALIGVTIHADSPNTFAPPALAHISSLFSRLATYHIRATHARPLHPAAAAHLGLFKCEFEFDI